MYIGVIDRLQGMKTTMFLFRATCAYTNSHIIEYIFVGGVQKKRLGFNIPCSRLHSKDIPSKGQSGKICLGKVLF